jgi:predicted O-methyltransferase YrrM
MSIYNESISSYITQLFVKEDEIQRFIRQSTPEKGLPDIGITPEEGGFLHLLVRICRAKLALEIGTLGGYSGIWIARALDPGGKLITIEKSARHAEVAREHFQLAGVSDRVEMHQGNAQQLLPGFARLAPFDFIFIDADKPGYPAYYEWSVNNLRPAGVIAVHNALWGGAVVNPIGGEAVNLAKSFNERVANDPRVSSTIYPAGDGMLLAVKLDQHAVR